jgi:hypothetical protein
VDGLNCLLPAITNLVWMARLIGGMSDNFPLQYKIELRHFRDGAILRTPRNQHSLPITAHLIFRPLQSG